MSLILAGINSLNGDNTIEDDPSEIMLTKKDVSFYLKYFFFAFCLIAILFGLILLIIVLYFWLANDTIPLDDWKKWLLMIGVMALYACFADWIGDRLKMKKSL